MSTPDLAPARDRGTFAYLVLLALGALDAAAYSVIAPVAPTIAAQHALGPGLVGVLVAAFPAGIVVGFAAASVIIRRRGYPLLMLWSLVLLGGGAAAFALADQVPAYLGARVVMGIGSGGLWMAVTLSTLDRWPGQEYLCMSRIFAAYSIGGLLGPALGALGGVQAPFVAYTALTVVGLILAIAMGRTVTPRIFATDRAVLRLPAFWAASAGILFAVLALGVIEGVLPLLFARQLSQPQIALVLAGVAIVVAVAAATTARFGARAALLGAAPFIVFGIGIVGASGTLPIWLVGLAMAAVGVGLANTGSIGVLLAGVPIERSMTALVVWSQIGIVGYLAGPLIGGASAEAFGYPVLGAVLFLAALPLLILTISSARPPAAALHGGST